MTMTALGEVLALLDRATPGEWEGDQEGGFITVGGNDIMDTVYSLTSAAEDEANIASVAAAINYLRAEGPKLLAMVGDAEKWRYAGLACNAEGVAELKRRAEAAERRVDELVVRALNAELNERRYWFLRDNHDSFKPVVQIGIEWLHGIDADAAIDAALATPASEQPFGLDFIGSIEP